MKKIIVTLLILHGFMGIDAAQIPREFNSPEEVRRAINRQRGLKKTIEPTPEIEQEIGRLEGILKEMEGEEGVHYPDIAEGELYDVAEDAGIIHPKISERAEPKSVDQEAKESGDEAESSRAEVEQEEKKERAVLSDRARQGANEFERIVGIKDLGSMVMGYDRDPWAEAVVSRELKGHNSWVDSVAVTPDDKHIVTGSYDGTARVWDIKTGKQVQVLGHEGPIRSVAVTPDGKYIVTESSDKTARVWDINTGEQVRELKGHKGLVHAVAVTPDGKHIVTGSYDKTARVWGIKTGKQVRVLKGHRDLVLSVVVTPDGKHIVTGSGDRTARVWDREAGEQVQELKGHRGLVLSVAVTPDGKHIVTGSSDKTVRVWDIKTGEQVRELKGHESSVFSVAVTPDGKHIVTGSNDKTARVWDIKTGEQVQVLKGHEGPVFSVAVTPDGKHIVTGSSDETARVWSVEPPGQESVNKRLIAVVQRRIAAGSQTQEQEEQEGNVKRALAAIRILIKQGANPNVLVPTDGRGNERLWLLAENKLGLTHPIARYLKQAAEVAVDNERRLRQTESMITQARRIDYFPSGHLRAMEGYVDQLEATYSQEAGQELVCLIEQEFEWGKAIAQEKAQAVGLIANDSD